MNVENEQKSLKARAAGPSLKVMSFDEMLEKDGYLVYTSVGKSMQPLLRERRDVIEIRRKNPGVRCRKYDVVLYKYGMNYILHRVLKVRDKDYVICGDHNIWREYGITEDQILGVMNRVIRDGKTITTDDFWYRVYVHLWCDFYHVRACILYTKRFVRRSGYRVIKMLKRLVWVSYRRVKMLLKRLTRR